MKKFFIIMASAFLLVSAGAAEKVIAAAKETVLSTETQKGPIINKAFYVFKPAKNYRGKKVVFRMEALRRTGNSALGITFRCSTSPGNQLRVAKPFKIDYSKNGVKKAIEIVLDIPDLDNIAHFNMHAGFRRMGTEKCVWELSNIRFTEYEPGKVVSAKTPALPEGFAVGTVAAMVKKPLELVKNGKINFVIVTADKPDHIARYGANGMYFVFPDFEEEEAARDVIRKAELDWH